MKKVVPKGNHGTTRKQPCRTTQKRPQISAFWAFTTFPNHPPIKEFLPLTVFFFHPRIQTFVLLIVFPNHPQITAESAPLSTVFPLHTTNHPCISKKFSPVFTVIDTESGFGVVVFSHKNNEYKRTTCPDSAHGGTICVKEVPLVKLINQTIQKIHNKDNHIKFTLLELPFIT